jgi:transposase-like protein
MTCRDCVFWKLRYERLIDWLAYRAQAEAKVLEAGQQPEGERMFALMEARQEMTTAQVADALGVTESMVRYWRRQGRLPYSGGRTRGYRYEATHVERLKHEREQRRGGPHA